jgi:predicted RND superfamily exporter protein
LIEKANEIAYIGAISNLALTQKEFAKRYKNIDKYDFKKLKTLLEANAKLLKFKEGYFSNAYTFIEHIPSSYHVDLESLKEMGYEVIEREGRFYTLATVDKERIDEKSIDKKNIDSDKLREGVYIINGLELIKKSTQTMFESLLFYLFIAFFAIVLIIFIWVREKIILALNFILFPIAIILLYLSVVTINIMHLFSIIIIIVAGIDYGIYMSKEHSNKRQSEATTEAAATMEAIFYSLFTSFSGFGILILSSIGAIHSIGVVITIGILSILFLVLFLKNS